jgi:hypothetical protein
VDEQEREQPALLLAAERDGTILANDLERPEDPELDHGFLYHLLRALNRSASFGIAGNTPLIAAETAVSET